MTQTAINPNDPLSRDDITAAEQSTRGIYAMHDLGYTEMDAYATHRELFRRIALGLRGQKILAASGVKAGSPLEGTDIEFNALTEDLLVTVRTSESPEEKRHSEQSQIAFTGPILTPLTALRSLTVTRVEYDVRGVPEVDFKLSFEGIDHEIQFTRETGRDGEARRTLYYYLRDRLARS